MSHVLGVIMNTGVIAFMLLLVIIAIGVFLICVPVHIYKIFSSIFNRTDADVRYSIYIVMIKVSK